MIEGPKFKCIRDFSIICHSKLSKAFSKSMKSSKPGLFLSLVKFIISSIVRIFSPMKGHLTLFRLGGGGGGGSARANFNFRELP